ACLAGVHLDQVAIALAAGDRAADVADSLVAVATRRGVDAGRLPLIAGIDPVGCWLRAAGASDLTAAESTATDWARRVASDLPAAVPLLADGSLVHEAGGGDVEELGTSIAIGVHLLRVAE